MGGKIEDIESLINFAKSGELQEHRFSNVELKAAWQIDHGKKICSAANKISQDKSWLVVGMDDKGVFAGHNEKWAKDTEVCIAQQINDFLNPAQAVRNISCYEINKSWVIIISIIPPGALTQWKKQAYKIAGTSSTVMSPEETMQLIVTLPGLEDFSAQQTKEKCDELLVSEFVSQIYAQRGDAHYLDLTKILPEESLQRLGLLNKKVSQILFGEFSFRVVVFDSDNEVIENRSEKGLIKLLSDPFIKFVQHNGGSYSIRALKEALANTIAHAAYYEKNGDILVEIYPDKLTISNLCLPEAAHFANKWFSRSRNTTNRLLMETLRLGKYVDELGRGKNLIFSESIKSGQKPPIVHIEKAGQYCRWRLFLYPSFRDSVQLRLYQRVKNIFKDEFKSLVACALVLWKDMPVSEIIKFIDGESVKHFIDILDDVNGPVFYYKNDDRLVLQRWARVLIEDGQDAKTFTPAEEEGLRDFARKIQTDFHKGYISPKELRQLAHLSETSSERMLSSKLLKKWTTEGHLTRISDGKYKFIDPSSVKNEVAFATLLEHILQVQVTQGNTTLLGSTPTVHS